jgi:Cdc6-like AAA superfamily ATPase
MHELLPLGTNNGFLNPSQMSDEDWSALRYEAEQVFTPGTPIKESDLFAGRKPQIEKLTQRIRSPGSHAVVYGERGVGKSSLVNVFKFIADSSASKIQYVRVAGVGKDTFTSLFMKVFKRITIEGNQGRKQLSEKYDGKEITADDVLLEFLEFAESATPIIVIDELDKIVSQEVKQEIAETIKLISDERANATIFVVGIADNVADLIEGHESIDRAIAQVEMPRMSDQEIIDVIHPRVKRLGLKITEDAIWDCVFLCKGLPHYAHLIGLHASQVCCDEKTVVMDRSTIKDAEVRAIGESNNTIRTNFDDAIFSERDGNIYLPVLVACALVKKDQIGRFYARDVAKVLSDILGKKYDVPAFSYHLDQFTVLERGRLLEKLGNKRQFKFRFREALSEPYVVLKGREAGLITGDVEKKYGPTRQPDLFSSSDH